MMNLLLTIKLSIMNPCHYNLETVAMTCVITALILVLAIMVVALGISMYKLIKSL